MKRILTRLRHIFSTVSFERLKVILALDSASPNRKFTTTPLRTRRLATATKRRFASFSQREAQKRRVRSGVVVN